jgi:hypothetical protein
MKNISEEVILKNLASMIAESIIDRCVKERNGDVPKNLIQEKPFGTDCINKLPENLGRDVALANESLFNFMLDRTFQKRLEWYVTEGFAWEDETFYYFFTNEELEELLESFK